MEERGYPGNGCNLEHATVPGRETQKYFTVFFESCPLFIKAGFRKAGFRPGFPRTGELILFEEDFYD
jgi:hypothetical protein